LLTDDRVLLAALTVPVRRPGLERSAGGISTTSAAQTPAAELHLDAARREHPLVTAHPPCPENEMPRTVDYNQTPLRGLA